MAFKNEKNPNCIISYKRLQHENVKLFKLKKNNGLIYNNTIYRLETLQRVLSPHICSFVSIISIWNNCMWFCKWQKIQIYLQFNSISKTQKRTLIIIVNFIIWFGDGISLLETFIYITVTLHFTELKDRMQEKLLAMILMLK